MSQSFYADLHIHSKYSRACSRDCDLEHLTPWARRKGISVVGTGDFTHPAWHDHLRETLIPAEPGLFQLRPDVDLLIQEKIPGACKGPVRFMLSVEISTIYKRDDRTRKVHHLVYLPDFASVARFNQRLGRIGNLGSDGRPILGLDSRNLLEITLEASPDGYIVPAHIWTPWFSAMGSKSGFDAIADCYADLSDHIFAVETGLSSDPLMNWRVSSLDRYRLVSNSDAHSPPALGREATVFSSALDYFSIRDALRTGDGFGGTVEFFPEEGKYHADGHRVCQQRLTPTETIAHHGDCPVCGKPTTVGVLSRVEALADRPEGQRPEGAAAFRNLVPLPEILGEINKVGPKTKTVDRKVVELITKLGPELEILTTAEIDDIVAVGGELLGEAISRLRAGDVIRDAGYDGEYGVIKLFGPGELEATRALFALPADAVAKASKPVKASPNEPQGPQWTKSTWVDEESPAEPVLTGMEEVGTGLLDRLDLQQRVAACAPEGPLLVVAGPGAGKTRTLTHRIAYLLSEQGVTPDKCVAITFTRRAAEEMAERLESLVPEHGVRVTTFHGLGMGIIREHAAEFGLTKRFKVARADEQIAAALTIAGTDKAARELLAELPAARRDGPTPALVRYTEALRAKDLVDVDELVTLPVQLLDGDDFLQHHYRTRWPWLFVDEYQDVDATQYALLRLLCPPTGNLYAIGDPDQAIYRFRGANVEFFLRFREDFPDAQTVRLARNYRSHAPIVAAAVQAIAPGTLVEGRILEPQRRDPEAPLIGRYAAASPEDEADFVARTIDQLVGGSSFHSIDSGRVDGRATDRRDTGFADIAVLYRTDAQSKVLVDALTRAGIPVQKRSHDRLADRAGVAEIAAELRLVGAGRGGLAGRVRRAAKAIASRPAKVDPVDLHSAVDLLTPLADRHVADLDGFLHALATGEEVDAWDPRADRVTLLTLHAAKGLEFPTVFLVGAEDGLLPLRLPGQSPDPEEIGEERRLLFVGITRAQDRLYVSHAAKRTWRGVTRDAGPSPFLEVVDRGLWETLGTSVRRPSRGRQLRLL